jgi:transposase
VDNFNKTLVKQWYNINMSRIGLSKEEVKKRLIRLRNLERLHIEQKMRVGLLEEQVKLLKEENHLLKTTNESLVKTIEDFKLQIEELRVMVFGKKKKTKDIDDDDLIPPKEKIIRTNDSYKRPTPKDDEVTEVKNYPLNHCKCGTKITKKKMVVFYEEDITIPIKKIVRKYIVEKSYCPHCKCWQTDIPLPRGKVILGSNVRKYVCYLNIICRLSFSQIQGILNDIYQMNISEGEIAKILNQEAIHLRPFYEQLKVKIRGEPGIHLDETGWKLLIDGSTSYSWVMSGTESHENVFLVGESRGGGNVEKLIGNDYRGFVVTDDYNAYKKLERHQLCWAHLIRKFRDLARSGELTEETRLHCKMEYQKLCLIFDDLRNDRFILKFDEFTKRLSELSIIKHLDPKKLIRYKITLQRNIEKYLTCLYDPRIPLTNNQAERSLRHLVLKRKISFGSLTKRTADNLAVLMSLLMSLKQRYPSNFFGEYLGV